MKQNDSNQMEPSDIALFLKIGIIVLCTLLVIGLGIEFLPNALSVSNIGKRKDLPIYCVNTDEKKIALSFDVAWGNEDMERTLAILSKHEVKATFFITGEWARKYPKDVQKIAADGHDLGNHGESHKLMSQLSPEQCKEELMKLHKRVKELTGIEMNLFRAPYGDFNNTVVGTARECKYDTIQWDVDSLDWKDYGMDSIIKCVVENKKLGNGSILLLHTGTKYTSEALEQIILGLKEKGYQMVPVSQLIYKKDYTVDHTGRQIKK